MSQEDAITQNCYHTVKSYNWGGGGGIKLSREQQEVEKVIKSGNAFMIGKQMGFYQLTCRKVEKNAEIMFYCSPVPFIISIFELF